MSHHGQHANCRECKTNPRARGAPRAAFDQGVNRGIPESSQTAREIEMAENAARMAELAKIKPAPRERSKARINEIRSGLEERRRTERLKDAQMWGAVDEAMRPALDEEDR